jgi:hypothetical protein
MIQSTQKSSFSSVLTATMIEERKREGEEEEEEDCCFDGIIVKLIT